MSENGQKATSSQSIITPDDIKSELSKVEATDSDRESDDPEANIYKNLTKGQLHRARTFNECFICQKRFKNFSSFRSHIFRHTDVKKYNCEKCFKEFAKLQYLKAHLTTHNENRVFTCEICSRNFASRSSIRGHMRVHTGEKPYKCDVCDRAFSESSTRRKHRLTHFRHMQIHSEVKTFECPICSKLFATQPKLQRHMIIHTNRQYICKQCSKGFYHRTSLWKHMKRSCIPLKPVFQCEVCAKLFEAITAQMQSGEEGSCKLCGKFFPTALGLGVHLNKHIGDQQFQCQMCANKYTKDGNLERTSERILKSQKVKPPEVQLFVANCEK